MVKGWWSMLRAGVLGVAVVMAMALTGGAPEAQARSVVTTAEGSGGGGTVCMNGTAFFCATPYAYSSQANCAYLLANFSDCYDFMNVTDSLTLAQEIQKAWVADGFNAGTTLSLLDTVDSSLSPPSALAATGPVIAAVTGGWSNSSNLGCSGCVAYYLWTPGTAVDTSLSTVSTVLGSFQVTSVSWYVASNATVGGDGTVPEGNSLHLALLAVLLAAWGGRQTQRRLEG